MNLAGLIGMGILDSVETAAEAISSPLAIRSPDFPVKAKRALHIFASGAPSHLDTFDPKPALARYDGKTFPDDNNADAFASPSLSKSMHGRNLRRCCSKRMSSRSLIDFACAQPCERCRPSRLLKY
jgi:hypothetical protein